MRSSPAFGGSSFKSSTELWFRSRVTRPFMASPFVRFRGRRQLCAESPLYGVRPVRLKRFLLAGFLRPLNEDREQPVESSEQTEDPPWICARPTSFSPPPARCASASI